MKDRSHYYTILLVVLMGILAYMGIWLYQVAEAWRKSDDKPPVRMTRTARSKKAQMRMDSVHRARMEQEGR